VQDELAAARKQVTALKIELAMKAFSDQLSAAEEVKGAHLLAMELPGLEKETLGWLADTFREKYPDNGICVIATISGEQVIVMAAVTQDLIKKGIKAGDLVGHVSRQLGRAGVERRTWPSAAEGMALKSPRRWPASGPGWKERSNRS